MAGVRAYILGIEPVSTEPAGLQIVDVSDPTSPSLVGLVGMSRDDLPYLPRAAAITGDRAFVALWRGIEVIDVADATAPRRLGTIDLDATAVAVLGNFLVAVGSELVVIDVSEPSAPAVALQSATSTAGTSSWAATAPT